MQSQKVSVEHSHGGCICQAEYTKLLAKYKSSLAQFKSLQQTYSSLEMRYKLVKEGDSGLAAKYRIEIEQLKIKHGEILLGVREEERRLTAAMYQSQMRILEVKHQAALGQGTSYEIEIRSAAEKMSFLQEIVGNLE